MEPESNIEFNLQGVDSNIIDCIWLSVADVQFSNVLDQLEFEKNNVTNIGLAMGKNALSLADALDQKINFDKIIVLQPKGYSDLTVNDDKYVFYEVSHPLPTKDTFDYSQSTINLLRKMIDADPNLILHMMITGGASASFVIPEDGISMEQYIDIVSVGMNEGFPIEDLNFVRIIIDKVKGGKFVNFFPSTKIYSWIVSDVISDDPAIVGSGPTSKNSELFDRQISSNLCKWMERTMDKYNISDILFKELACSVKQTHQLMDERSKYNNVINSIILSRKDFVGSLITKLNNFGIKPRIDTLSFDLEIGEAAVYLEKLILENLNTIKSSPIILMGEIIVKLNSLRGEGGRISALCFLVSQRLQKYPGINFLGFATDGKDGQSPDPGYLINSQTFQKLTELGDFDDLFDSQNTGRHLTDIGTGIKLIRKTNINLLDLIVIF